MYESTNVCVCVCVCVYACMCVNVRTYKYEPMYVLNNDASGNK